jgi:DNA-binding NarL/FixJ family response regulator
MKSAPLSEVVAAVRHASESPLTFSGQGLAQAMSRRNENFGLTTRELEVLAMLVNSRTSAKIAEELFVSEATVKTHLSAIYRKLKVSNRTQAVVIALKNGLAN